MARKNKAQLRLQIEQRQARLKKLEISGRLKRSEQKVKLGKAQELLSAASEALDNPTSLQDPEELMRLAEPIESVLQPMEESGEEEAATQGEEQEEPEDSTDQSRGGGADDALDTIDNARDLKKTLDKRGAAKGKGAAPTKAGATAGRPVPVASRAGAVRGAAGGVGRLGGSVFLRALMHPYVLLALLVIALIVGLIWFFATGGQNGYMSQIGGSQFRSLSYDNLEHRAWVDRVTVLMQGEDPVIELAEGVNANDLVEWKTNGKGQRQHLLDARLVRALVYLADDKGWQKIVLGRLASDGPDVTRRRAENGEENIDAFSAYGLGQAMAIVGIGETSPDLTECLELPVAIPVSVSWQEIMNGENFLRSVYEPMAVQAGNVFLEYELHKMLMSTEERNAYESGVGAADLGGAMNEESRVELAELKKNLGRIIEATNIRRWNSATVQYATRALDNLNKVNQEKVMSTGRELRAGLADVFRLMQVANMVGWQGSRDENCRLWKAFEARQNIRQLTLDLARMPVELATTDEEGLAGWDPNWVIKQTIVYSPEDDLDNGLSDTDVFPAGPTSVGVGGLGFDIIQKDNRITEADNHFMRMLQDNGVIAKASTVFVNEGEGGATEGAGEDLKVEDVAINDFHELWDRQYESGGRVSYKHFVHVGV